MRTALLLFGGCHTDDKPPGECGEVSPGSPDEPPDCHDLGTPCSTCGGYVDVDPGCSGTYHEPVWEYNLDDSWCAMDQPLAEWCSTHLPCWHAAECPTFHEFLFVSGWLDTLPNVTPEYAWGWNYASYGDATVTRRCTTPDGEVFDAFEWSGDFEQGSYQTAYFDASTGELVSIWLARVDACCGDEHAMDRWWGRRLDCQGDPQVAGQSHWFWDHCTD